MNEFRAVLGPDHVARVVYVPESSPVVAVLHRSYRSDECHAAAETHNRLREEREAARAAGQGELWS